MSIVLTGDVHQAISASDQQFVTQSESSLAVDFARIAAKHGLKVTLFFTARALIEDRIDAHPLLEVENVEIGGHGWDALRPRWWHRLLRLVSGSPHGPTWLQQRMIRRTCALLSDYTGSPIRSWRNHAYRHDRNTPRLLAQAGVSFWSDRVELARTHPYLHPDGIIVLPLNTTPDHENMLHGLRTPGFVAAEGRGPSLTPEEWQKTVRSQVERIVQADGTATILAYPICMKVADDWASFEQLCSFLAHFPSLFASEVTARLES